MASDGSTGKIPAANLLQGSQALKSIGRAPSGNSLPPAGKIAPPATLATIASATAAAAEAAQSARKPKAAAANPAVAAKAPARHTASPESLVASLNKYLNDSGRPDQFRVDPASGDTVIQEINPANGQVIGEFAVDEFPALARSIGASGVLIDSQA